MSHFSGDSQDDEGCAKISSSKGKPLKNTLHSAHDEAVVVGWDWLFWSQADGHRLLSRANSGVRLWAPFFIERSEFRE